MSRPIHPESVLDHPTAVRWVVDTGELPVGAVHRAPGTLGPLLAYGVLEKVLLERGGVWTWLTPPQRWTEHGSRIRDAVVNALPLDGWEVAAGSDELLELVAHDVIRGQLGSYIASHGGEINVVEALDDVLVLDFLGACEDCPAAGQTLHERIEEAVRARYPRLKEISQRNAGHHHLPGWLGLPVPGRGLR